MFQTKNKLSVHAYSKPSTAFAAAAESVDELLTEIRAAILEVDPLDCREATWTDAESMMRMAIRLRGLLDEVMQ